MTEALRARLEGFAPRALVTLGSGLGALADEVDDPLVIPFADIGLPVSTVPGHAGRLLAGALHGAPVLVQQGRVHLYENRSPAEVTAVVRAAAEAGADTLIVTNAAGGLDPSMEPGELALLVDQLNLTGASPLIGLPEPLFVDMGEPYDVGLRTLAHQGAMETGERLREAVYAGLVGPAFETPAEVRMLRTLGADVVGMSTVLEVIAARAAGLRVLGFSLVTNVHRPGAVTQHAEVLEAGAAAGPRLAAVLRALLPNLPGVSETSTSG